MFLHIQKLGQEWKPETSVRGSEEQTEQREHPSGEAEGGEAMNVITEEQIEEFVGSTHRRNDRREEGATFGVAPKKQDEASTEGGQRERIKRREQRHCDEGRGPGTGDLSHGTEVGGVWETEP